VSRRSLIETRGHVAPVKPFRFFFSGSAIPAARLSEVAIRAEALGYDGMLISDHIREKLGPIAAMTHVTAVTKRLRAGIAVLNNDLRHPIVLAQELASIDQLSGGRLIVGIGAGWNELEYAALGVPYDRIGIRIDRLAESIAVIKAVFQGQVRFSGKYYQIAGLEEFPRSVQKPYPPFLIGGTGRRMLSLAAREAQIVGLSDRSVVGGDIESATAAATDVKLGWIREAAGDRFAEIEVHSYPLSHCARVTNSGHAALHELVDWFRADRGQGISEADLAESPHVLIGSVDHIVEKLQTMRERWGINVVTLDQLEGYGRIDEFAPIVERLAGA
jgi:probable F420-dependent oxidoreductase